jgi:hypothetical protein
MEFKKQTITMIISEDTSIQVPATIGVGTGLAYTQGYGFNYPRLMLVHVPSGYEISEHWVATEEEAQLFLEHAAKIDKDQWNIDLPTLKQRHMRDINKTRQAFERAQQLSLIDRFMYVDDKNDILVCESITVESVDPEVESNKKLVAELFAYYPEAAKVTLVKMPASTGRHEVQHVYERSAVMTAA